MTVVTSLVRLTVRLEQMLKIARLRLECSHPTFCYICMSTLLLFDVLTKVTCVQLEYKWNAFFSFDCNHGYSDALQWAIVRVLPRHAAQPTNPSIEWLS